MRVSIIVPTYKDITALKLILDAFMHQTYKNFEVIVAEDDNAQETKDFLNSYNGAYNIQHFSHEDKGNRKPRAVNSAIKMSDGEYIIFIDGDTIPFKDFVAHHVALASPQLGLCGRRVNLGDKVSADLREGRVSALEIEEKYFRMYTYLHDDNMRHYEQGIVINPKSFLYKLLQKTNKNANIVASNFSCFKEALIKVNGIDESLPFAPSRDDFDLQWRLEYIGIQMQICKYSANLLHLNHSRSDRLQEDLANREIIAKKQFSGVYKSARGIREL